MDKTKNEKIIEEKKEESAKKKGKPLTVLTVSFKFPMTNEEAYEILKNKNGKIAKKFRKYLNEVLEVTAKKCLDEYKKDIKKLNEEM